METTRLQYKTDDFGNAIEARVTWSKEHSSPKRPIVLIYHAGGLVMGTCEIVPKPQIDHLAAEGFVVVMPNYRLVPQVTGREAFRDAEEAFDWSRTQLPSIIKEKYDVELDMNNIVAMGHSSGGTMVLHLASIEKPLRAVLALYPFLFVSDPDSAAHRPSQELGGATAPSEEDWKLICPPNIQVSESPFDPSSGSPRSAWIRYIFDKGVWMANVQPDGDFKAIDPLTRVHSKWPPAMFIHGTEDNVPGRSTELIQRAGTALKEGGVEEVEVRIVQGAGHVFDHNPKLGTSDLGDQWQVVVDGLDWLTGHFVRG